MNEDALKLAVYLGERDRCGRRLASEALLELFERQGVRASALLRGIEGFGVKHRLQTERLLSLSEDLPLLALAVDAPQHIENLLDQARAISPHGLITLERVRLLGASEAIVLPPDAGELKLTIHLGRGERVEKRPAHLAVVDLLHGHGFAGASVLLGLDGTVRGVRRRARFLATNAHVPLLVVGLGESERIARALPDLSAMLEESSMTLERVQLCKRDGHLLADPTAPGVLEEAGPGCWQKLVVYAGEQARHTGEPIYSSLIRRLRHEGAAGATALRGQWGYQGDHPPHGERLLSLRRHVPVLTELLDTPANMRRWFAIVDELTAETGLVTSELVPALRTGAPGFEHGRLSLAPVHPRGERTARAEPE
jgi:PII-like signaling protein